MTGFYPIRNEDELCIACCAYFDKVVGDHFGMIHIPNGGSRNVIEGAKFKKMGVRAGVPDYLIMKGGCPVGFMEFKFGRNHLQASQKAFKDYVLLGGFRYAEIRSFDDFVRVLANWGITGEVSPSWRYVKYGDGVLTVPGRREEISRESTMGAHPHASPLEVGV